MDIMSLINKLKNKPKPKSEEEIKKDLEQKKEIALIKASKFRHLVKDQTGWAEFCGVVVDYIDAINIRKLKTRLDTATPEMLQELKYMDRDIMILNWILQIPEQFINKWNIR